MSAATKLPVTPKLPSAPRNPAFASKDALLRHEQAMADALGEASPKSKTRRGCLARCSTAATFSEMTLQEGRQSSGAGAMRRTLPCVGGPGSQPFPFRQAASNALGSGSGPHGAHGGHGTRGQKHCTFKGEVQESKDMMARTLPDFSKVQREQRQAARDDVRNALSRRRSEPHFRDTEPVTPKSAHLPASAGVWGSEGEARSAKTHVEGNPSSSMGLPLGAMGHGRSNVIHEGTRTEPSSPSNSQNTRKLQRQRRSMRNVAGSAPSIADRLAQLLHAGMDEGKFGDERLTPKVQSRPSTGHCRLEPLEGAPKSTEAAGADKESSDQVLLAAPSSLLERRKSSKAGDKEHMRKLSVSTHRAAEKEAKLRFLHPKRQVKVLQEHQKIFDLYYWDEVLQEEGDGGKVVVCQPKLLDGTEACTPLSPPAPSEPCSPLSPSVRGDTWGGDFEYVMKIRAKASLDDEDQFRELQVRMLNFPSHINVMPIHEVLEDDRFFYVVMQKAKGGSFFSGLLSDFEDGIMPENAMKMLMKEILASVKHVHSQGMLHRDIKPDNLVMQVRDDPASPTGTSKSVVLIDFDHADPNWSPVNPPVKEEYLGTMRFNAPETFLSEFSPASDLYSVGCILYLLMSGKMPYPDTVFGDLPDGTRDPGMPRPGSGWRAEVHRRMGASEVDFSASSFSESRVCEEFCRRMISMDLSARFKTAREALSHAWLVDARGAASKDSCG